MQDIPHGYWDASKGMPVKEAYYSSRYGEPKPDGQYISVPEDSIEVQNGKFIVADAHPYTKIWNHSKYIAIFKVYVPYVREEPFDYAKFKSSPVDLKDASNLNKIERKIGRVLQNLGVAYIDRAKLIFPSNDVPSSGWFTDSTGKEGIALNPWLILQANTETLVKLVKKEVIHRALYRNLSDLSNKIILNFTLDVLAMRVIAQSPYEKLDKPTVRLAEKLFNPAIYKQFPIIALCDCSLTEKQVDANLPAGVAQIWKELYGVDRWGNLPSLRGIKPSALYFKIKSLVDEIVITEIQNGAGNSNSKTQYPFNVKPSQEVGDGKDTLTMNDDTVSSEFDKKNSSLNKSVGESFKPKRYRNSSWFSNQATDFWNDHIVQPQDYGSKKLAEFAKKWKTDRLIESVESKILAAIGKNETVLKPYPEELTYDGQMFVALDISNASTLPIFWNKGGEESNRKKVVAIFDLSGSMQTLLPYISRIIDTIEDECDLSLTGSGKSDKDNRGAYAFSTSVIQFNNDDLEKMRKGEIKCAGGTSFEEFLQYYLKEISKQEPDIVLIFTDGVGGAVHPKTIEECNKSNKKFFNIYMRPSYETNPSYEEGKITSDLDKLNGESFTLFLPPIDGSK